MTAEKPGENNDPTCNEGVEISAETSKDVPSSVPSVPSPGPLLRRQDSGVVPPPSAVGSICWLNMVPSNGDSNHASATTATKAPKSGKSK